MRDEPKPSWKVVSRAVLFLFWCYILLYWIRDYYEDGFIGRTSEDQFSFFSFITFGSGLTISGIAWLITKDK